MTIVDDQYKSWRTYFETCMNAAVYSSTPNILEVESDKVATSKSQVKKKVLKSQTKEANEGELIVVAEEYFDVYEAKDNGYSNIITKTTPEGWKKRDLVKIDKNYQLVAPYKNLSFRCRILVMTPQLSTITKYDLLLVLKDFSEERSGEIDSSGTDLTLSFSIVGENPPDEVNTDRIRSEVDNAKEEAKKKKEEQKKLDKNLNNLGSSLIKHGTSTVVGLI